jgi:hypothetical protein
MPKDPNPGDQILQTWQHLRELQQIDGASTQARAPVQLEELARVASELHTHAEALSKWSQELAEIGENIRELAHESRNALQRSTACLEMLGFVLRGEPKALDLLNRVWTAQNDLHRLYERVSSLLARASWRRPGSPCEGQPSGMTP